MTRATSMVLDGGIRYVCPENLVQDSMSVFRGGEYELAGMAFVRPPRILDIGACCGAFSTWAGLRWPGCTVDAYEPNPTALRYLRLNAQPHMTVHPLAVVGDSHEGATAVLREGAKFLSCSGIVALPESDEARGDVSHVVDVVPAWKLPRAELVKIDCEGNEPDILEAYDLTDTAVVMVETHTREDRKRVEALMAERGLTLWTGVIRAPWLATLRFVRESAAAMETT